MTYLRRGRSRPPLCPGHPNGAEARSKRQCGPGLCARQPRRCAQTAGVSGSSGKLVVEPGTATPETERPWYPGQVFAQEDLSYVEAMTQFAVDSQLESPEADPTASPEAVAWATVKADHAAPATGSPTPKRSDLAGNTHRRAAGRGAAPSGACRGPAGRLWQPEG